MMAPALWAIELQLLLASSPPAQLTCHQPTASSITLSWPAVPGADAYAVALAPSASARPFELQLAEGSAATAMTLIDLLPSLTYHLRLRSHAKNETLGWGWRQAAGGAVACSTAAPHIGAARSLRRRAAAAQPSAAAVALEWEEPLKGARPVRYEVGVRQRGTLAWYWATAHNRTAHSVELLSPSSAGWHEAAVRAVPSGIVSEIYPFRVEAPDLIHTEVFRISEFQFDVDFLNDHNGADSLAMPLFLGFGAVNESSGLGHARHGHESTRNITAVIDRCSETVERLCPGLRGSGQTTPEPTGCMACALSPAHRTAVAAACGHDTDDSPGFSPLKWFCGVGFPESTWQRSPTAKYCVSHLPAPQTDPSPGGDGFAQFTSCNSDYPLSPRDPFCVCWNVHDRLHNMQAVSIIDEVCGPVELPWAGGIQCNCSEGEGQNRTLLDPSSSMARYVGRTTEMLPNNYYHAPMENYPIRIPNGHNYGLPGQTACKFGQSPDAASGCTWSTGQRVGIIYGDDLMAAGWNVTRASPLDFGHVHARAAAYSKAWEQSGSGSLMKPRCCGC